MQTSIVTSNLKGGRKTACLIHMGSVSLSYVSPNPCTAQEAKQKLLDCIGRQQSAQISRKYIVCNDGTMLAVYFNNGWCYDIIHPESDRGFCSSTHFADDCDYSDAVKAARSHAEQSYGGIKSEH
jgi:hypothetical protein